MSLVKLDLFRGGETLINAKNISSVSRGDDPSDFFGGTWSRVKMKSGEAYRVCGRPDQIEKKLRAAKLAGEPAEGDTP